MNFLFFLALICLFLGVGSGLELYLGCRQMRFLRDLPLQGDRSQPLVSIIVPALNEEKTIGPALTTLLALDYDNMEVIVVNDRSTDNTGAVVARLAEDDSRLRLITVRDLPGGWLGKNHALHVGARQADGEYLLFTDADVLMEQTTLKRAIRAMRDGRLDHLSLLFDCKVKSSLLRLLMLEVGAGILLFYKPWKAADPKSKRFMGIGAFNLVRADVYRQCGGHEAIAMEVIDDIMLGKLFKSRGFRQECMVGHGLVAVEWYSTLFAMMDGVMKNMLAGYHYSLGLVVVGILVQMLLGILPLWGLLFSQGAVRMLFGLAVCLRLFSFVMGGRRVGIKPWHACWILVTTYICIYMTIKAVAVTLFRGGINWRGTFYPLSVLKSNRMAGGRSWK